MAKAARFKVGWSGSGNHTETVGDGSGMGGPASKPSDPGPRIGPGALARVRPEYARDAERNEGRGKGGSRMKTYEEG